MKTHESNSRRRNGVLAARALAAGALFLLAQGVAQAEEQKRCLVIHVTQADPKVWVQALNMVSNVPKALGMDNVDVELVAQGPGLGILKESSHTRSGSTAWPNTAGRSVPAATPKRRWSGSRVRK